ncbi:WD40-repeat-containing domain protein [Cercophora scortea]|uniref:WD40-repeat-containing domain protein n=1 Tax=Cercophora scortea TaxID=314031 RepID=A0AAE0J758_9PEZI|nr:WD40-repeat-containing domain protein [Cercophora scortea]
MASSRPDHTPADDLDSDNDDMLAADDAQEVLDAADHDGDMAMDSDDDDDQDQDLGDDDEDREEINLQNDSIAFFDQHKDSVFAIAQHPLFPNLVATGGSEGDADDAPGKGYVIDTSAAVSRRPVLPASYSSDPNASSAPQLTELAPLFAIDGHTDSINALAFTLPSGDFLVSAGMDGRLRAYTVTPSPATNQISFTFLAESQEVEEITWVAPCPSPLYPNTIAFGASDGSVWVLSLDASDPATPIQIIQTYFLHTASSTAGAWTPDGALLASVSEDASLHVFDVWGTAAAKSLVLDNGQTVVSLTDADNRFAVEGGLYSVAIAPTGAFLAVGGAQGAIRVVSLPRLSQPVAAAPKANNSRAGGRRNAPQTEATSQAGMILASLNVQTDGIESLSFAPAPQTLLAAGSVDGSIAVFDSAKSFAVRRHVRHAHDGESVVKVAFVRSAAQPGASGWLLTSCGLDGAVKRWDLRGATASEHSTSLEVNGLVKEWKGHRGGGEGGGVLDFVQGETGERIVTAGDDSLVLVFEA